MNLLAAADLINDLRTLAIQKSVGDRIAGEVNTATNMLWVMESIRTDAYVHAHISTVTVLRDRAADEVNRLEIEGLPVDESFARGELNVYNLTLKGLAKIVES